MESGEEITVERFEVRGRVQGVGFRYWTLRTARSLGVRGTVRNRPDGAVEVTAAGERQALLALRDALAEGPPGAHVTDVRRLDETAPAEVELGDRFEIIR
ncbi:MAG: acylphosphatase [Gemmatimonadota bacterium]